MAQKPTTDKVIKEAFTNGIVVQTRLTNSDDIAKFLQWKIDLENKNKTIYNEIRNIIVNEINDIDKKDAFRKTKDDLFYYLRKAIFASMSPFKQDIDNVVLDIKVEQNIINKKLDLLINLVAKEFDIQKDLEEISGELLKENKYFKDIKDILEARIMLYWKKSKKQMKHIKRHFKDIIIQNLTRSKMKWKVNKKIFIGLSSPILVLPFLNVSATRTYNTKYSTSHNEETWDYWKISSYDVLDNEGNINKFDEDFQVYIPGVDPLYDLGFLENFSYTRNYDNKIIFNSPDIDKVYWPQEYTQIWKNQIFNLGDSLYTLRDDDNIRFILPNGDFSKYWDNPDLSKINIINNSEIWNDPLSDFKISYDSFPGIDQKNINNTYHKIYNKTTIDLTKLNENDGFIVKRKDKNYSYNYSVNSIYVFNKEKFINNFLKNNYSYSSNPLKNFGDDNNLEIKYIKDGIIAKRSQEYGFIKNIYWNENEDTSKIYVDDDANQIYITVRDGQEKFNISKISGYSDIQNQMYEIPYSTSNGLKWSSLY
ncbi:Mbov_0398 family ICE element protein [Mycoplasmopsis cynos]|uniref:Mbov_0398 family ICE element protein n=1 Tax=Mycoplasmopsis cynos TaxID=171284 RepID=UPI0021FFE76D|nr:hypothetical protein [Mycoplasmopsis cynos]UWV82416.1 hypothetical protein NW067_05485 [Mycoplasmopsis cynos]